MFKLAFRNVFRQRMRTGLTLSAVGVGVAALIVTGGFVEDILIQLRESVIHSQLGHVQIYKSGYNGRAGRDHNTYLIENWKATRASLEATPHVSEILPRLAVSGLISNGHIGLPALVEGIEPSKEEKLGQSMTVVDGRPLADADIDGIAVGEGVAQALRLKPGDRVTILANSQGGALNTLDSIVVGIFRSYSRDFDARSARISLTAAQDLIASQTVSSLVLALDDTAHTAQAEAWLAPRLPGQGLEMKTWRDLAEFYTATSALYERQFDVLKFIILIMVLLTVTNSVNTSAFERQGEFGTMMALGSRKRSTVALLLTENLLLALGGSAAGVLLGVMLAIGISSFGIPMPPPPNSTTGYVAFIRVVPSVVCTAFLVGVMAVMLASLAAAHSVSRLGVADALRQNV